MNKKIQITLYMMIGILAFSSCCKKELQDPPTEISCGVGFEVLNDSCFCPEGNYVLSTLNSVHPECRSLEPNEYYAVISDSCSCYEGDTMVTKFDWEQNKFTLSSWNTVENGTFLSIGTDSFYTTKITSYSIINLFKKPCIVNNMTCGGQLAGIKSNDDTLHLKLYIRSLEDWYSLPLDSCDLILTK